MSSLSIQTSVPRSGYSMVGATLIRAVAVLTLLLLAGFVELAAENYFDPQHRIVAAEMSVAP
jgi:hypothetical protein